MFILNKYLIFYTPSCWENLCFLKYDNLVCYLIIRLKFEKESQEFHFMKESTAILRILI